MVLFNIHFFIMHMFHALYMYLFQGHMLLVKAMHTHFQKYGHILMQQQAQVKG